MTSNVTPEPTRTEPAAQLRLAAETLRVHLNEVSQEDRDDWEARVDNWLGGPVGQLVALLSPPVVLALADWLEANAAWMAGNYPSPLGSTQLDGVDVAAAALARAVLREGES